MAKVVAENGLSEAEVQRFWEDGFLVIDGLFSPEEVEALREACASPQDQEWKTASETVHSLGITSRDTRFLELAREPRIVSRITPLIGPDVQLQHSKLAAQPAQKGKGGFGWHQDFAFFPHTNTDLVAVMVMLDDATPENGCMSMVKGSHRLGLLDHANAEGFFVAACQEFRHWEAHPDKVVPITPKAGGISIHHCLTLHGSGPNPTGYPRRGIVFQYRAADAYQLSEGIWDDTGLQICGERPEQVRCESGTFRLPKINRRDRPFGDAWNQEGPFARAQNERDGIVWIR